MERKPVSSSTIKSIGFDQGTMHITYKVHTALSAAAVSVTITLTLEPAAAAALHRLVDKLSHTDAQRLLYPHVASEIRSDQAYEMVRACAVLQTALEDAGVRHFPWIETGVSP